MNATLEPFRGDWDRLDEPPGASSYFQTTMRMGKRDMQEETKRAVDTAFGVGFLGGAMIGPVVLVFGLPLSGFSGLLSPSLTGPPSFHNPANQRIVRCWDNVVRVQRTR